jgi:hypothetical protein
MGLFRANRLGFAKRRQAVRQEAIVMVPHPEPANWVFFATTIAGVLLLLVLYCFGVWLRSYVLRTPNEWPIKKQLLASVPVGLITMAVYGKTSLPGLNFSSPDVAFDICLMAGYTIIFGMMSREALESLLKATPAVPALPKI